MLGVEEVDYHTVGIYRVGYHVLELCYNVDDAHMDAPTYEPAPYVYR